MSILIPGMGMPTDCCQCPVNMEICKRDYKYLLAHPELYEKRADDCPLVPVPDHGRLIDADALRHWIVSEMASLDTEEDRAFVAERLANELPTIIPASKEDQ